MKNSKLLYLLLLGFAVFPLTALEGGPHLYLRADFGGTLSLPSISDDSLKQFNKDAVKMTGMLSGLLISGELEGGYIFDSNRFFGLRQGHPFSALGVFAYIGVGQGNTSQKVSANVSGTALDTFMVVDFTPVIDFGLSAKAYFFKNRLALGAGLGGRMIADMSPDYLVYSTDPSIIETEVGANYRYRRDDEKDESFHVFHERYGRIQYFAYQNDRYRARLVYKIQSLSTEIFNGAEKARRHCSRQRRRYYTAVSGLLAQFARLRREFGLCI